LDDGINMPVLHVAGFAIHMPIAEVGGSQGHSAR
jgi:hypothetical protein